MHFAVQVTPRHFQAVHRKPVVRLVGRHADEWLTQLRDAMSSVEEVRARGPHFGTTEL